MRATGDFSGRANVTAEVTQALHVIEGGGNLAVGALGADVLRVFVELVAFGGEVGAHGVLVVEIKEVDGLRDDAEDACRTVIFPPGGGNARIVDGEQGNAVAVVAEVIGVCSRQATSDGSEVVQFSRIECKAFLREQDAVGWMLEEGSTAATLGCCRMCGGVFAQDVGAIGFVRAHLEVLVCPQPQPAAALVSIAAKAADGEGIVVEGEDAAFQINTPGGCGVGNAVQGGLFVEGEGGVF